MDGAGYIYIYIFVFQIKIKDLCCLVLLLFSLLLEINSTSPNDFCDSILFVWKDLIVVKLRKRKIKFGNGPWRVVDDNCYEEKWIKEEQKGRRKNYKYIWNEMKLNFKSYV